MQPRMCEGGDEETVDIEEKISPSFKMESINLNESQQILMDESQQGPFADDQLPKADDGIN